MADTPQDPREYARQKFREVLASLGKTPTGPGSGPTDEEYYLNRIMQEGGWDTGYDWAGRIKRGIEGTQPPLNTPGFDPSYWGPVAGQSYTPAPLTIPKGSDTGPGGITGTPPTGTAPADTLNTFPKPNDQRSPNVHSDVDVNGIVEKALQNMLMGNRA